MFREGGKGFGIGLRDIAEEHKKEVDAVKKIYAGVLGMSSACKSEVCYTEQLSQ